MNKVKLSDGRELTIRVTVAAMVEASKIENETEAAVMMAAMSTGLSVDEVMALEVDDFLLISGATQSKGQKKK